MSDLEQPTMPSDRKQSRFNPLRPPGWPFAGIFGALTAIMLATGWIQNVLPTSVLFVAAFVILGVWLLIGATWATSLLANLRRYWDQRASWWRWVWAPPIVFVIANSDPGINLRFWFARPELERLAVQVAATPAGTPMPPDQTVWFTNVNDIQRLSGGGMRFATFLGGNPFDYEGLAYSSMPLPESEEVEGCIFRRYCGNWYTFWKP